MNRLWCVILLSLVLVSPAWGYTVTKYPNPYRQTMWNDFTDSLHTLGQTPSQAVLTKRKLHQARTRARLNSINLARNKAILQSYQ